MIKTFLLAENIMCVYRNYVSFSGYKKVLILIRITLEIIWMLITILIFVWQVSEQFSTRNHFLYLMGVYHLTNALCGIALVICGVQYSESYKLFLNNFEVIRHEFQNSPAYTKNIKKLKRNLTILIVFFAFVSIIDFFFKLRANMITWRQNHIKITFLTLLFTLVYIEIRKILVNSIHYANITILRSTLESLTDRVSEIREKLSKPGMSDRSYKLTVAIVDEWAVNYQKVLISSKLLSECAGCQVICTFFLICVLFYLYLCCLKSICFYFGYCLLLFFYPVHNVV
ncbi:hypothetical protein B5X24_HaOG200755 [Helicoverpa armigera]|nr:hypothetical protein B5X24_HaOG200755 [Helicoverpa armigera]